jgi:hypothetical protein
MASAAASSSTVMALFMLRAMSMAGGKQQD